MPGSGICARPTGSAEHLAQVGEQRSRIETEIARWEQTADDLVTKTATWSVARVDAAMAPILREIEHLRAELATIEASDIMHNTAAEAVSEWDRALSDADLVTQRAIIKQVFPRLTLARHRRVGDQEPDRFHWNGLT